MDALKKAEEEKKKAAKRLEQVEANARAVTKGPHEEITSGDVQAGEDGSKLPKLDTDTVNLSLEPLPELFVETKEAALVGGDKDSLSRTDTNEIPALNITAEYSGDQTLENTAANETFEQTQKEIDLSDTVIVEGLSMDDVSAPFDDTFQGVLFEEEQETEVFSETLPGVPADELAKDLGGGKFQPTPVAAQTVFSAGKGSQRRSLVSWGAFVVLALLATGSFAVFYYFTITPVTRNLPSPRVARGIEFTPVPLPAITSIVETEVVSATIMIPEIEEEVVVAEEPTADKEATVAQESDISVSMSETDSSIDEAPELSHIKDVIDGVASNEISDEVPELSQIEDVISDVEELTSGPIVYQESKQSTIQQDPVSDDLPEVLVQADPEAIKISKNISSPKHNIMLSEAFKAFQSGQFDTAELLYRNVLKEEPDNRDVHLGLAAIAINKGDKETAYAQYYQLLDQNPDDALALSSLISLSNNTDPLKDESVIKILLHKEGEVPYLYFSLGNIYARQLRWAEAQQAFFNAYSLDSTNSDYVLNLAISLDKIGQYVTALDFYSVAVEMTQYSSARFDLSSVNSRILTLSKIIESKL